MTKHTPTPWTIKEDTLIGGPYGQAIAKFECWPTNEDAAFIVKAVNSHAVLVDYIERLITSSEGGLETFSLDYIERLIKEAEGYLVALKQAGEL